MSQLEKMVGQRYPPRSSKGIDCQGHDFQIILIFSVGKIGKLLGAPLFDSEVNFKVLVAMATIVKPRGFKQVAVFT